jgi:hypothetical protein
MLATICTVQVGANDMNRGSRHAQALGQALQLASHFLHTVLPCVDRADARVPSNNPQTLWQAMHHSSHRHHTAIIHSTKQVNR